MMNPYRIVLADDHVLLRQGLRRILTERPDMKVVGEAGDGLELLTLLKELSPDLLILDISMPNLRGIEAAAEIRRLYPEVKILVLTMHKDTEFLREAMAAGADGYLLKENADSELFSAIAKIRASKKYISPSLTEEVVEEWSKIHRGEGDPIEREPLTTREREVLKLIAEGKSSREIGDLLYISVRTVERHRSNVMNKLNLRKTADLVKYALKKGYL